MKTQQKIGAARDKYASAGLAASRGMMRRGARLTEIPSQASSRKPQTTRLKAGRGPALAVIEVVWKRATLRALGDEQRWHHDTPLVL